MLDRESDQADLDEVLLRVDEARQALPKILRALEPARRSVEGPSHSERLNLYKTAVKDANRSLTDLRDHFQEHQGRLPPSQPFEFSSQPCFRSVQGIERVLPSRWRSHPA